MPTQEGREGPTPNGGVRSVAYFRDDAGDRAEKAQATQVEIVEYDAESTSGAPTAGSGRNDGRRRPLLFWLRRGVGRVRAVRPRRGMNAPAA